MERFPKRKYLIALLLFFFSGCVPTPVREKPAAAQLVSPPVNAAAYHYSLSVLFSRNGKVDEAIGELERALDFDSKSGYLVMQLAALLSEKGNHRKAISLCEKLIASNGDDVDARLMLAGLYMKTNEHQKALQEYAKVSELDPRNVPSHLYAAILYGDRENYEKALSSLRALLAIDPDHLMGNYYLAKTLTELHQYGEAEEKYKKVLALRPFFEQAIIELASLYERQGKNILAVETCRDFIKLSPQSVNVRLKLFNLLTKLKRVEEAERELQETLVWSKGNREVGYTLGLFYLEGNQPEKAIEVFTSILKSHPDDYRLRYLLGSAYEEKKDYGKAIAELEKIPPDADLYANAMIGISMIMKKEGRLGEAIGNLSSAAQTRRDVPDIYIVLSSFHEEKKELEKAEEVLKTGLRSVQNPRLHYSLGVLYEKTGRYDESIQEMQRVLKLDDNNADAMNFIGYTYADRGINLEEAEALIKRALELKPGNGYILDSLGWVYFRQNKMEQAIKYLLEASLILPDDATTAEHLGDAYAKSGRIAEAVEIYRRALKLNPGNSALKHKIDQLIINK